MEKKTISNGLKKATEFIGQLAGSQFDLLGYPTIKMHSDFVDVTFRTHATICGLDVLNYSSDGFSMFADLSDIVIVYTFYDDED